MRANTRANLLVLMCFFVVCSFLDAVSGGTLAQTPNATLPPEVQQAITNGLTAAKRRDWELAIKYFGKARESAPTSPHALFNLALANDNAGDRELFAIAWYRAYLAAAPNAANAQQVRSRIVDLEARIEGKIQKFIHIAKEAIPGIEHPVVKNLSLGNLAEGQAKTGDIKGARKTAETMVEGFPKSGAFSKIALAQLETGDINGACNSLDIAGTGIKLALANPAAREEKIDQILALNAYAGTLVRAVEELIKAGDTTSAKKMAASIDGIKYPGENANAFEKIAGAQAKAGDIEGAKKTAEGIKLQDWKALAIMDIAFSQAEAGDIRGALKTAEGMDTLGEGSYFRSKAFWYIASQQVNAGDKAEARKTLARALETAALIKNGVDKFKTFNDIARAQAAANDTAGAGKTADRIESSYYKTAAFVDISIEQIKAGDQIGARKTLAQAKETAAEITDYNNKSNAYKWIAVEQAKAGDMTGAGKTAEQILSDNWKRQFYKEFAKLQIKVGDMAGAKKSIDEMTRRLTNQEIQFWTNIDLGNRETPLRVRKDQNPENLVIDLAAGAGGMASRMKLLRGKAEEWKKVWAESTAAGPSVQ